MLPIVVYVAVVVIVVAVIVIFVVSVVVAAIAVADQFVAIVAIVIRSIVAFDVTPTSSLGDQHLKPKRRMKEMGENETEIESESESECVGETKGEMEENTMVRTSNTRKSMTNERIGRSRITEGLRGGKDIVKVGKGMMTVFVIEATFQYYSRSRADTSSPHS